MEKVRHLTDEDEGVEFTIPEGAVFFSDVCYEDGTPVIITKDIIIKVGKRKFVKVIL